MPQITVTDRWRRAFPGGCVGTLLMGNIDNAKRPTPLDPRKREIEARLRAELKGLSRAELHEVDILKAYRQYYKRFDKTYHVQLQLESVAHKGKPLPDVNPLVDANFAAELETLVLTAGHDADLLAGGLTVDASRGDELMVLMSGASQQLKPGDMMMSDAQGVICTIIYGQDKRTPISERTRRALYVAYAPSGVPVATVQRQLDLIRANVLLVAPNAAVEETEIFLADPGGEHAGG